jgi:1-acyl-sn-glycerol-3-phosphate acyltransferase
MGVTYSICYNVSKMMAYGLFSFRVVHRERIIETGGALLAMNHQSYFDPPLASICCRRQIYFLALRKLLKWPILGSLFPRLNVIPVDPGRADMIALKSVIRVIKAGNCAIVFPEGARTRDGALRPARPGLGLVIAKTLAPVVPMRIFGAHEAYPRGQKFPKLHPITIVVGEPIRFTEADLVGEGRDLYQALTQRVMDRIAAIEFER